MSKKKSSPFNRLKKLYRSVFDNIFALPFFLQFLLNSEIGKSYTYGFAKKLKLIRRFKKNIKRVPTESTWLEHIEMASAILKVPSSVSGDVIEFGCFKGGSSVNLSIVCNIVGRKLLVCDSFEGLPEPKEEDKVHYNLYTNHYDHYEEGRFATSLDEVKSNITQFGCIDAAEFVVGYFENSLKNLNRKYIFAFFDADFVDSLKPCLHEVWPNLQDNCRMYVHEATSLSLVALYFDKAWWKENLNTSAPGFVGAGTGLPLKVVTGSLIGFAQKGSKLS